jgi:uncharacterized membrane protein YkvA (DUF1232 family)
MEKVGVSADNARSRALRVREKAGRWIDLVPAPAQLKRFVIQFVRVSTNLDMPAVDLAILVAAVAYVIMPFDFIPDLIPFLGWGDDVTVMGLAMKTLSKTWNGADEWADDAPKPDIVDPV